MPGAAQRGASANFAASVGAAQDGRTMVKQGSFFQRLKERFGSGSGVRVDSTGSSGASGGSGPAAAGKPAGKVATSTSVPPPAARPTPVQRVEPERALRDLASEPNVDVRSSRKMSDREEAMAALGTHFQELTSLLRGSQARVDDQLSQIVAATGALVQLPTLGQQQLDTLRALSSQMERQNVLGEQLASTMARLPNLLENVETALARAAATDERTSETVREFQATMDRIHSAMGQMVQHGEQHVRTAQQLAEKRDGELKELATGIASSQRAAVGELKDAAASGMKTLERSHDEALASLRRTHEDQSNRLQHVVREHAGWNRAVLAGIGLVVLGIGALIALQLFR
jgi:predicted  nucleic acid-binding Zn-ribbon protein